MKCPLCKRPTKVLETREGSECVRRRRKCTHCSNRFTTFEWLAQKELSKPTTKGVALRAINDAIRALQVSKKRIKGSATT